VLGTIGIRLTKQLALSLLALAAALIVILPVLAIVHRIYTSAGIYVLLAAVVVTGCVILFYQARVRPWLPHRPGVERRRALFRQRPRVGTPGK
jgi:hypothetical protein